MGTNLIAVLIVVLTLFNTEGLSRPVIPTTSTLSNKPTDPTVLTHPFHSLHTHDQPCIGTRASALSAPTVKINLTAESDPDVCGGSDVHPVTFGPQPTATMPTPFLPTAFPLDPDAVSPHPQSCSKHRLQVFPNKRSPEPESALATQTAGIAGFLISFVAFIALAVWLFTFRMMKSNGSRDRRGVSESEGGGRGSQNNQAPQSQRST